MYLSDWFIVEFTVEVRKEIPDLFSGTHTETQSFCWCMEYDHVPQSEEFRLAFLMLELKKKYKSARPLADDTGETFKMLSYKFVKIDKVIRSISYLG